MSDDDAPDPFRYESEVDPGEKRNLRYEVGETYMGDPIEVPATVTNGEWEGPTAFLTAAIHGDELYGVKVLREVADRYSPAELRGTLVCVHVANVPGYPAQQRDIPIYDQDLDRSFPGRPTGTTAGRIAHELYTRFLAPCDFGRDFHTSTRNWTTMFTPGRSSRTRRWSVSRGPSARTSFSRGPATTATGRWDCGGPVATTTRRRDPPVTAPVTTGV